MLKPACAMPLGESSVMRPNYSSPWLNNNLSIPVQNFIPMPPNMVPYHESSRQAALLSQFQSMQIRSPNISSGMLPAGYFDPTRMMFIPPSNFAPFNPPREHIVPQNARPNVIYEQQMDQRVIEVSPMYPIPATNPSHVFQETSHPTMSEYKPNIVCEGISEQQLIANANLELANRLSASHNIMADDKQLLGSSPLTVEASFSPSDNDFPPLK